MRYIIKGSCYPTTVPLLSREMNRRYLAETVNRRDAVFDDDTQSIPLMFVGHLLFH